MYFYKISNCYLDFKNKSIILVLLVRDIIIQFKNYYYEYYNKQDKDFLSSLYAYNTISNKEDNNTIVNLNVLVIVFICKPENNIKTFVSSLLEVLFEPYSPSKSYIN